MSRRARKIGLAKYTYGGYIELRTEFTPVGYKECKTSMNVTRFSVPDLNCGGCAASIRKVLDGKPGVYEVAIDIPAKAVTIRHDGDDGAVADALGRVGFPVAEVVAVKEG
jgi:copper chaperone